MDRPIGNGSFYSQRFQNRFGIQCIEHSRYDFCRLPFDLILRPVFVLFFGKIFLHCCISVNIDMQGKRMLIS